MTRISEKFDRFGNPIGHAFDLGGGDEERVQGERILFYYAYPAATEGGYALAEMKKILSERGFRMDARQAPGLNASLLSGYSQLWFVSDQHRTLSDQDVQTVANYVGAGNGLAIWGDNDPYNVDANLLAHALVGTRFVGNMPGQRNLVPGAGLAPGYFIEHPLTQGVNNLYEGHTIPTIAPTAGVTILGRSHDGQNCLGCYEREGRRVALDAGFTKLFNQYFHESAGLGRYLSNIAFWLARGARDVRYQLLTPGRGAIATIRRRQVSQPYVYTVGPEKTVTLILQWDGNARLKMHIQPPAGTPSRYSICNASPTRITLTGVPGPWTMRLEGLELAAEHIPYVLSIALRD